ncbi:MAG: HNH endonuclease [Candidatus Gastranaerophilales bacterium]|nr:HNH endonuclease [Candidatus Gastranaerophilales bacterium]MCM1525749.1 HNH endonuclease [Bacteroides sp.]
MKKLMNLNKETALRLWTQQFGKGQKAIDFSGREIAKAAYNDRNSTYGWNVDHILPLSRGGKTADHNLICCHILTNDEKSDKFPCFKANEKNFEIQKRQNHYEIIEKTDTQITEENEPVNFLDVAQGLECWKQCKPTGKNVFTGYVKIKVEISNESNQLLDRYVSFLMELFGVDNIFIEDGCADYKFCTIKPPNRVFILTVVISDIPTKEDSQNLLDDCVTLNTYNDYFIGRTGFKNIQIVCGMECYRSRSDMSLHCKKDIVEKQVPFAKSLAIDELVRINTNAKKDLKNSFSHSEFYPYNFTFTRLKNNLAKYI